MTVLCDRRTEASFYNLNFTASSVKMLQIMLSTQRRCRAPTAVTTRVLPALVASWRPAIPSKRYRDAGPTVGTAVGPGRGTAPIWSTLRAQASISAGFLVPIPPLPPAPSQTTPISVMPKVAAWQWIVHGGATGPLLIRTHYDTLYKVVDKCLAHKSGMSHNLLLTGNPGIGKSLGALNYLLLRTLAAQPDVVVVTIDVDHVEVFCVDKNQQSTARRQRFPLELFTSPPHATARTYLESLGLPTTTKLLLLHDQKATSLPFQENFHSALGRLFQVTCVLSPKEANYRNFLKCHPDDDVSTGAVADGMSGVYQFILPLWSKDETKIFVDAVFPHLAPAFDSEFKVRGGVPRSWRRAMPELIGDQNVAFAIGRITLTDVMGLSLRTTTSSKLLGLVPSDDCRTVKSMQFVSQRVEAMAFQADARVLLEEARTRYEEAIARNFSRDVVGRLFESMALKTVAAGWPLSVARLSAPLATPGIAVPVPKLTVAPFRPLDGPWTPLSHVTFGTALGSMTSAREQLFIPVSDSFPFTDAIFVRNGEATLLQTTVSRKHPPTKHSYATVVSFLGSNVSIKNIVWMVPMTWAWRNFGYQRLPTTNADFDKVNQYVCPVYSSLSQVLFALGHSTQKAKLLAIPFGTGVGATTSYPSPTKNDYAAAVSMYVTGTPVTIQTRMLSGYEVGMYTPSNARSKSRPRPRTASSHVN